MLLRIVGYQGKWHIFLYLCCGSNSTPCKVTVQQISVLSVSVKEAKIIGAYSKGYKAALNHVFTLVGTDLSVNSHQQNVWQL